jgi:predicted alpha/beta hydrolase family esterase
VTEQAAGRAALVTGRRFLVLHGWENHRPVEHWEWWLTDRLRAAGEQVLYPQLPSPDHPRLNDWLDVFHGEWQQMGDGERVVVAHSLGCLLWLHAAARDLVDPTAHRVLLVAPPSPVVTASIPAIAGFVAPVAPSAVRASSRSTVRLLCSDRDPYSTEGTAAEVYGAPLGLDVQVLPGAGHFTVDDGYGPFPDVLRWCLGEDAPDGHRGDGEEMFTGPRPWGRGTG